MLRHCFYSLAIFALTTLPVMAAMDPQIEQDEPRLEAPVPQKDDEHSVKVKIQKPHKRPQTMPSEVIKVASTATKAPKEEQESTPVSNTEKAKTQETETEIDEAAQMVEEKPIAPILPDFAEDDIQFFGTETTYISQAEDTLLDIARHFGLGFVELQAANTEIDPWAIMPETEIKLPLRHILPRAEQKGIIVNLADMRIYYFKEKDQAPITFPVGIGREGLNTPQGTTKIVRKKDGPIWYPTERMREENPDLPKAVPAGPANPLGTHALYLGWPTFLIHGTNKPWGIGRRVSSGCMRMYPENIAALYEMTPKGTQVQVVEQDVKMAWHKDALYLEVHPKAKQTYTIEETGHIEETEAEINMPKEIQDWITYSAQEHGMTIDWDRAKSAYSQKQGTPIQISFAEQISETAQKKQSPAPSFNND